MKTISSEKFETTIPYKIERPVQNAKKNKFKNCPSIKMIMSKRNPNKRFSFFLVPSNEILKQTIKLDIEKTKQKNNIPRKPPPSFFSNFFNTNINQCIEIQKSPSGFKEKERKKSKRNQKPQETIVDP